MERQRDKEREIHRDRADNNNPEQSRVAQLVIYKPGGLINFKQPKNLNPGRDFSDRQRDSAKEKQTDREAKRAEQSQVAQLVQ
jgi:hypothetical protein